MSGIPKNKKEDIVNVALEIVKEKGFNGLNARDVAKRLKCSIQPIFYQFKTMDELKDAVLLAIYEIYKGYMLKEEDSYTSYKSMGISYVRFAKDYLEFFKILFMQQLNMNSSNFILIDHLEDKVIVAGQKYTGLSFDEQKKFHLKVWVFTHGVATLIANKTLSLDDEEIEELISSTVRQILKGYKMEKGEIIKWKNLEIYYGELF